MKMFKLILIGILYLGLTHERDDDSGLNKLYYD